VGLIDVLWRLGAATIIGAIIGADRELRHKPAGLKTLALVALGGAFAPVVMLAHGSLDPNPISRVIQGVLTGVGFLGAGVIMNHRQDGNVEGLTTAAAIWLVAGIGVACGVGLYMQAGVATAIALLVLVGGRRFERRFLGTGNGVSQSGP